MAAPSVPLIAKTWVLKVSIHCEGCKRKVQKVLRTVAGVSTVNIETKLQKVTVTGNVEADTLIQKLIKSGKHAELWPEPAEKKEKPPSKPKKKEKQVDPGKSAQGGHGSTDVNRQELKGEPAQSDPPKTDQTSKSPSKPSKEGSGSAAKRSDGGPVAESKTEEDKPGTGPPGNSAAAAASNGGAGNNSGDEGKKENIKGQKREIKGESPSAGPPGTAGSDSHDTGPPPANVSPPRHQEQHDFPPRDHVHPPTYAVTLSYSTAHPAGSYTTAYFSPPRVQSYGYMYQQVPEIPSPPLDLESHPPQPLDSFEMFSDENPNGCAVM